MIPAPVLELVTGGLTSMILTKLKAAGLSALAAGVLIAGALTVGAQAPAPRPTPVLAPDQPAVADNDFRPDPVARTPRPPQRYGDPAEAVIKLARDAHDRQAAGDTKGARQTLRHLHAVIFEWEDVLTDGPVMPPVAKPAEARPTYKPSTTPALTPPMTPVPRSAGDPDLEARMRRLEEKLDRLIRSMDRPREAPPQVK
jgi:hypothetical protein